MQQAVSKCAQFLLAATLVIWPRPSPCSLLQADPSASRLVVRAGKSGILRAFAHDHEFTPGRWQAEVDFDPEHPNDLRVDVRIDAATLHDHVARLAQRMRDYVDRETAGPQVLDAQRYPEIRFQAGSASARGEGDAVQGVLHGALSLHGTTLPLDVPFHARAEAPAYRVSGTARFRQTDYGMTPFSSAGGTIGVDDEVQVEFELVLVPASGAPGRAASCLVPLLDEPDARELDFAVCFESPPASRVIQREPLVWLGRRSTALLEPFLRSGTIDVLGSAEGLPPLPEVGFALHVRRALSPAARGVASPR